MQLVKPVGFPEVEVFKRFVEPAFDLIKIEPDSVMPSGYGPIWYPLLAPTPGFLTAPQLDAGDTIEHEGVRYAPRHVVDYMPLQPYVVFDVDWFV